MLNLLNYNLSNSSISFPLNICYFNITNMTKKKTLLLKYKTNKQKNTKKEQNRKQYKNLIKYTSFHPHFSFFNDNLILIKSFENSQKSISIEPY